MKTATYHKHPTGEPFTVKYDENSPCVWCGFPVVEASMGGTACCPWCDMGICRFVPGHRVDNEGIDPMTGKMHLPKEHYRRWGCATWKIDACNE